MTTAWSQPSHPTIVLMIVLGMLSGCASVFKDLDDKIHRKRFKVAHEAFENAIAIYNQGDFEQALTQFKALSTTSASEKVARKAWLGEICCRLMLANTQAQYNTAIGMWHDFGKSASEYDATWKLSLIDPLIVRITPKNTKNMVPIRPLPPQSTQESEIPMGRQNDDNQQENQPLQDQLADLKKKAQKATELQRKLDEVAAENRSLKEKIKALEAIDQNIQKKKTEISAPSE